MTSEMTLTYQTRLFLDEVQESIFGECACLFSTVERFLYAEVAKGKKATSCKNDFLKKFCESSGTISRLASREEILCDSGIINQDFIPLFSINSMQIVTS